MKEKLLKKYWALLPYEVLVTWHHGVFTTPLSEIYTYESLSWDIKAFETIKRVFEEREKAALLAGHLLNFLVYKANLLKETNITYKHLKGVMHDAINNLCIKAPLEQTKNVPVEFSFQELTDEGKSFMFAQFLLWWEMFWICLLSAYKNLT